MIAAMNMATLLCASAFITFLALSNAETCTKTNDCACQLDNGQKIDLSPLDGGSTPRFASISEPGTTYMYRYNPCTPVPCDAATGTAVCQYTQYSSFTCGSQDSVQFKYDAGRLNLEYSADMGGTQRNTLLQLICDENVEGETSIMTQSPNGPPWVYTFTLTSKYACPVDGGGGGGGLSGGDILLIIFFVCFFVYVAGGVAYNIFVKKHSGTDAIPNKNFWFALPSLAKDGSCFVKAKVTGGGQSTYQDMDQSKS